MVEYYRDPTTKDDSGWRGPATIVSSNPSANSVTIKTPDNREIRCRFQDVRRVIQHVALVFGLLQDRSAAAFECYRIVLSFIDNCAKGKFHTFGYLWTNGRYEPTRETKRHHNVAQALDYIVSNVLRLPRVLSIRLGRAINRFPLMAHADRSLLIWWNRNFEDHHTYETDGNVNIHTPTIVGDEWNLYRYIQLHFSMDAQTTFSAAVVETTESSPDCDGSNDTDVSARTDVSSPNRVSTIAEWR